MQMVTGGFAIRDNSKKSMRLRSRQPLQLIRGKEL